MSKSLFLIVAAVLLGSFSFLLADKSSEVEDALIKDILHRAFAVNKDESSVNKKNIVVDESAEKVRESVPIST